MSLFKLYLAEAQFADTYPVPGDTFSFEIVPFETIDGTVTKLVADGIVVEMNTSDMDILEHKGILTESGEPKTGPRDSTSPIHGKGGEEPHEGGVMSPINGSAFLNYDVKKNPRTWFTKKGVPDGDRPNAVTMMGVPGKLSETKVFVKKTTSPILKEVASGQVTKVDSKRIWLCRNWQ